MLKTLSPPAPVLGRQPRGVQSRDVDRAADVLLRAGERPTVEKIRAQLGGGSPNTINPLLDQWWQRLASRLDAGPKALNRLPEEVIHAAESLWYACIDQARINATAEMHGKEAMIDLRQGDHEMRTEVLRLREQELNARLSDRDRIIAILESETKAFASLFKKEQIKSAAQGQRIVALQDEIDSLRNLLASLSIRTALKRRAVQSSSVTKSKIAARKTKIKTTRQASKPSRIKSLPLQTRGKSKRIARKRS